MRIGHVTRVSDGNMFKVFSKSAGFEWTIEAGVIALMDGLVGASALVSTTCNWNVIWLCFLFDI